ncbi:MAG: hypothetical protein IAG10_09620, partial [Planctomycetaceae bacterium]|nr:hypothetical protein [Planctomycetaceae bacterium]
LMTAAFTISRATVGLTPPARLLRALTISIYFWSAVSKFDVGFYASHGQILVDALFQAVGINAAGWPASVKWWLAFSLPLGELLVAVGLCWPRTRQAALIAATALHIGLILALGPMGLGHRPGVLLWNVAFIGHDWLLFGVRTPSGGTTQARSSSEGATSSIASSLPHPDAAFSPQRGSTDSPELFEALKGRDNKHQRRGFALSGLWNLFCAATQDVALGWHMAAPLGRNCEGATSKLVRQASVCVILFACAWPITGRWGLCDRWLAWSVYSTQIERVSVTLTDEGVRRLPESARRLVVDGELWLDRWSLAALGVPIYPQLRFQFGVVEGLRRRCGEQNLVEVNVQHSPREGGVFERLNVEQFDERSHAFWINTQPRP